MAPAWRIQIQFTSLGFVERLRLTKFDYLAKLPIGVLKIDQSLTRAYSLAPDTWGKLVKAIVAVANTCELEVIAEGVESKNEASDLARVAGVQRYQGYAFGKAVPQDVFLQTHAPKFL